jgi:hypothetical protein
MIIIIIIIVIIMIIVITIIIIKIIFMIDVDEQISEDGLQDLSVGFNVEANSCFTEDAASLPPSKKIKDRHQELSVGLNVVANSCFTEGAASNLLGEVRCHTLATH